MKKMMIPIVLAGCLTAGCAETDQFVDHPSQSESFTPKPDPEPEPIGQTPAFPGAEGFGRYTTGGRGGKVYHVTTLNDGDTKGTLRYAVSQKGPRTVVFDVAGIIRLKKELKIEGNDITIAGQTAPGQGVCIADYPVTINADNVILRYLRFRVGTASIKDGGEPDGLGGTDHKDLMIDHCSISWSVDECCSVYGSDNLTVQWCMVTESLVNAGHSKGAHGYGGNWGGAQASYHHNLMAHHGSRVPRLGPRPYTQEREYMDLRNNVFYNWSGKGQGCYGGEGMKVNIVNNYFKPGPATGTGARSYRIAALGVRTYAYCHNADGTPNEWFPMMHVWGKYYVNGNVVKGNAANETWDNVTADNWTLGVYAQIDKTGNDGLFNDDVKDSIRLSQPLNTDVVTTHTAEMAFEKVLAYAGCSKVRDAIDERIVKETREGTATFQGSISGEPGIIDKPEDVTLPGENSPWPTLSDGGVKAEDLVDTDGDGIPDTWERAHGLDPDNAGDGNVKDEEGYTNLELYMNSLVEDITAGQLKDGIK